MQSECGVRIFSENRITLCVFEDKQAIPLPAGITNSRSRDFCSFFCIKMLADVGTLGTDPAKFCGLRLLQCYKIRLNQMQILSTTHRKEISRLKLRI